MSSRLPTTTTALLLTCLLPTGALAGDFIDTRVSFTLGDDNFFINAGEDVPDSPMISIGDREGFELPSDNLDLATTGRENELHLVLYKKVEGILPGLMTEVAANIEINLAALENKQAVDKVFSDDSSYIRLIYAIDQAKKGDRYLDLVLFPLSGDRFRVGYLYKLTWAGSDIFPRKKGPTPAFKLGGNHGMLYWWSGMKIVLTQTATQTSTNLQETDVHTADWSPIYSWLAGIGLQPITGLSLDLSGGHVQMAENEVKDVLGTKVTATGFSARVAYGRGLGVGLSSDLRLLRNDRDFVEGLSLKPAYEPGGGLSWSIAAEGNAIAQVLADPDLFGATKRQWASAASLQLKMQLDYLRINLTGVYRSLEFSLLNQPSYVTYVGFSQDEIVQPQIFAALSTDYHLERWALSPGIHLGIELPGAVTTELYEKSAGPNAPPTLIGRHTILVRSTGEREILPRGEDRVPVFYGRLTLRWYPSEILTLNTFVLFTVDQNKTVTRTGPDFTRYREFGKSFGLGAGVTAQARF